MMIVNPDVHEFTQFNANRRTARTGPGLLYLMPNSSAPIEGIFTPNLVPLDQPIHIAAKFGLVNVAAVVERNEIRRKDAFDRCGAVSHKIK